MEIAKAIATIGIWIGWGMSSKYTGIFSVITMFAPILATYSIWG